MLHGCDKYRFTDASPTVHGRLSRLLLTGPARHRSISKPAIADDPDLCLPHLHSTPPLGGSRRTIAMAFDAEKTRMVWLPDAEKI